jgi:5-methylcytosine-specific restriction endonuclease McrA
MNTRACDAEADQKRSSFTRRGYDERYQRLRLVCFERDQWRCVQCGFQPELVTLHQRFDVMGDAPRSSVLEELRRRHNNGEAHLHCDHVLAIADRPDLRLDLDNMQTLCNRCHSSKTMRELNAQRSRWR